MTTRTLVTGATGFIGSHVVRQLLDRGESVRVLVRDPGKLARVGIDAQAPELEVVQGDLLEPATLPAALEGVGRLHHIAGHISTNPHDRQKVHDLNFEITRNLFEACRSASLERIVYLSSIFALAGGGQEPVHEDSPWQLGDFPVEYVQAKRRAELFARGCLEQDLPLVFVYPCFCYGPGDVYISSSRLVQAFLRGRLPGYVNGGQNAMDVRDAAAGLILGMEHGKVGERYLVGGRNVTYQEILALLTDITGRRGMRVKLPPAVARAAGRVAQRWLREPPLDEQAALMMERFWYYDDSRARRDLGYRSRPLEDTLRDAVEWLSDCG